MNTPSMRPTGGRLADGSGIDRAAVAVWLLSFALVSYLGLKGGGYDPLVHDQAGIAVWWVVLAGSLAGVFPRRRPGILALVALGLFAAFTVWTWLSLGWTESADRTSADLARVAGYLGVFVLAISVRGRGASRQVLGGVAAAIVLVSTVALLSRLHPAWFPHADQTARFLSTGRERLSYPLNYWNALAALIAIGVPLIAGSVTGARSTLLRGLAAAALPALALTAFFTLSRGGIAAAFLALAVFLGFSSDRLPKLVALAPAGIGAAILVALAAQRDSLRHGLMGPTAHSQGDEMLLIAVAVCVVVAAVQACADLLLRDVERPRWSVVSRRQAATATLVAGLVGVVAAAALGVPGRASSAWDEFKQEEGPGYGTGRLTSAAGESRYQFWSVAAEENASKPLTGTGSGTFEFWWMRKGNGGAVIDTHSLYMQTLGELGVVGLVLLGGFLLAILIGGGVRALSAGADRARLAAALAGCTAFCFTSIFDWMWQVPVLPVSALLLAAVLVTAGDGVLPVLERRGPGLRLASAAVAILAILAIAVPLASTGLLRTSAADARTGDLQTAFDLARDAQNVQPDAASPRLQQALVLEVAGELALAAEAARAATEKESTNWHNWLVLSRIEAERGEAAAAIRDYRRARVLNPHSELFEG